MGVLQVLYALVWLFLCVRFVFFFPFVSFFFFSVKDTLILLSESTNETIHRGTNFFHTPVSKTDFGLRFCNCMFLTHRTTFWSLVFK